MLIDRLIEWFPISITQLNNEDGVIMVHCLSAILLGDWSIDWILTHITQPSNEDGVVMVCCFDAITFVAPPASNFVLSAKERRLFKRYPFSHQRPRYAVYVWVVLLNESSIVSVKSPTKLNYLIRVKRSKIKYRRGTIDSFSSGVTSYPICISLS